MPKFISQRASARLERSGAPRTWYFVHRNVQLQEKFREQNRDLYITFVVDLSKSFNGERRKGLWTILAKLGLPLKFLAMVMQLHEGQLGPRTRGNDLSQPFQISNGVRQGCAFTCTLFSMFFNMMLKEATTDLDEGEGVYIRIRMDGADLFNLRQLQAHTETREKLIPEPFADAAALVAHTERAL